MHNVRRWAAGFLALTLAAPVAAQDTSQAASASIARAYAEAVVDGCLPMAEGEVVFGNTADDDRRTVEEQGFVYGIDGAIYDRFGLQGSSVLNRSIMGHRIEGDDAIVLAVGGMLPGCKVILVRPDARDISNDVANAFAAMDPSWRELPFPTTQPGSSVSMRRFIMRDHDSASYLVNLISSPVPDSEMRLLATLVPIPAHVQIPEGF